MAVALTMARMRLAVLRHAAEGGQGSLTTTGVSLGALCAAGTLYLAATGEPEALAGAYALWAAGWMLGPMAMGGGDETLRPEHFALLGLRRRALAAGLLAAAFTGFAPLIGLVALLGLAVAADGPLGVLVAVPALLLQLASFLLLSKVATGLLGLALRTRSGALVAGLANGALLAGLSQIWVFLAYFGERGIPGIVWRLPSGWGLRAVRGEVLPLLGLALLDVLLLTAWAGLLSVGTGRPRKMGRPRRPLKATTPTGAVIAKELRTWTRDLARTYHLVFALSFGVCFGACPLLIGWDGMLPYAGPLFVVMAASLTSNLYGTDGTALWLTVMTPGSGDVRGRQMAWLAVVGPVAALVTGVSVWIADGPWPLALAVLPALVGGATGLVPLLSVYGLVPGTDPHKRGGNPLRLGEDNGGLTGLAYLMLALVALTGLPAGLVALSYGWAGVPVGVATGVLCAVVLGVLAARRLAAQGPELLHAMRTGRRPKPERVRALATLPAPRRALVWSGFGLGMIALFPQGIVAGIFAVRGIERQTWFLATYLDTGLRLPVAGGMGALGLALLAGAAFGARRLTPSEVSGRGR
ncbi:transporter [Actinocorallia aurea]